MTERRIKVHGLTKNNLREIARAWMDQAERDLEASRVLLQEGFWEWSCYAAQQAAEKAIKAVRILAGTPIGQMAEKSGHDLLHLLGHLAVIGGPSGTIVGLAGLTAHNIESRYPDPQDPATPPHKRYDEKKAKAAINLANGTIDYCKKLRDMIDRMY